MKQARPKESDWQRALHFARDVHSIVEYGIHPDYMEDQFHEHATDASEQLEWIIDQLSEFSLQRVVSAGHCAVISTCDPELPYLDLKPEIKRALEIAEIVGDMPLERLRQLVKEQG